MTLDVLAANQYPQLRLLLMLETVQLVFVLAVMETITERNLMLGL